MGVAQKKGLGEHQMHTEVKENISGIACRFNKKNGELGKCLDYPSMSSALICLSDAVIPDT